MVPRRLRLRTWSADSGCPESGSKINGRDLARTAFSSPSVNSVPTRLPSRPSRAISTASPIKDSSTSGSYWVTWQRMLSNILQLPSVQVEVIIGGTHLKLDEAAGSRDSVVADAECACRTRLTAIVCTRKNLLSQVSFSSGTGRHPRGTGLVPQEGKFVGGVVDELGDGDA